MKYDVLIEQAYTECVTVKAKNKTEAKKKAWDKYWAKKSSKKNFRLHADEAN